MSLLFNLLLTMTLEHSLHALVEMFDRLIVDVERVFIHVMEPDLHAGTEMIEQLLKAGTSSPFRQECSTCMVRSAPNVAQDLWSRRYLSTSSANNRPREADRSSPESSAESTARSTKLHASLQMAACR